MKADCAAIQPSLTSHSPRLFVKSNEISDPFLVDTGSVVSALPPRFVKGHDHSNEFNLFAANGSPIASYGACEMEIDLNLPKKFQWNFTVADVTQPILGADFLRHYNLLPDLVNKKLIDGTTLCSARCELRQTDQPSITSIQKTDRFDPRLQRLLEKYSSITQPPQYKKEVLHEVECFIETTGTPTFEKPRRLRPDVEKEVRNEYGDQLKSGLVRVSNSQWASGLIVKREKNKLRLIGDYRRLNAQTTPDRYPIPVIYDAISLLRNKCFFSKIDLVRAFHNIPVFEGHIQKTAVVSPAGLYEHTRMPFGLRNAPSTFQRFMHSVLSDLPFCTVYIDDILIFTNKLNEHYECIETIFQRLSKFGLAINLEKCRFCVTELDFLGYRISSQGFTPTNERVSFIKEMKPPKNICSLRRVLGLLNFYRQFSKGAAEALAPLQELLKGHPRKGDRTAIRWTAQLCECFEKAKTVFVNYVQLKFQREGAKLYLTCDASRTAIGAVLEQENENGQKEPLGFLSRKLTEGETKWPVYDLELLAVYAAAGHFEPLIAGRDLTIVTDHRPLTYMFACKKKDKIERRTRFAEYIAQFSTKIVHLSGVANIVADTLSRLDETQEVAIITAKITPEELAKMQDGDEEVAKWRREGFRDQDVREVRLGKGLRLLCARFKDVNRPMVPAKARRQIFEQVHNIAHNGLRATLRLIRSRYYWPLMTADIRKWYKACNECQRVKVTRHSKQEIGNFPECRKFEHIHMDLVGPMKPSEGYVYLCTFIDRTSRWIEAIPLRTVTAETVARAFYNNWIARYGTPLRVTTDRGPQFTSDLFLELAKLLGAQHIKTTAYHPQANGLVERVHRRLKELLMCHSQNWISYLPSILLGLRAAPRDESGISCAEMAFGQSLRLPGEMYQPTKGETDASKFVQQLRRTLREIGPAQFQHRKKEKIFIHRDLENCKRVFVRIDRVKSSLEPPYQGPYTVLKRKKHFYEVDVDGKKDTISISRLKPAYEVDGECEDRDNVGTTLRPILKKSGIQPLVVNEGSCNSNTNNNFKTIFVSDRNFANPIFPEIPFFPENNARQENESDQGRVNVASNPPNISEPPPQNLRQSSRAKKLPVRFKDFVT